MFKNNCDCRTELGINNYVELPGTIRRLLPASMDRGRTELEPRAAVTASPPAPQTSKPQRANRLSRSSRLTQVDCPRSPRAPEFKTPTRTSRSNPAAVPRGESPHNDSDFQQDIIWDTASPSPHKLGKRGKKRTTGVVNISEIVSRIAPKHGRPRPAEPILQQWIGDSATIPCTPDVQAPRPKRKSPRPSGVDKLLQLAKQFDLNMVHHDEDMDQQNLELISEDVLDFENGCQDKFSSCQTPVSAASGTDTLHLNRHLEDDLDFLFDRATQHVSGDLSQTPSQTKPASASTENCGKPCGSPHSSGSAHRMAACEFEDDWDDDDLLNDLLVLERTQDPVNFMVPKLCSTQKPGGMLNQSAGTRAEKENVRPVAAFKLQLNSDRRIETYTRTDQDSRSKDRQQNRFSAETRTNQTEQTRQSNGLKPEPQKSQSGPRSSAGNPGTVATFRPDVVDFMDSDLDSLFSSDLVWDDPADDDLLCEMCEDLESQIQNLNNKQTLVPSKQRAALQPIHRTSANRIQASSACGSSSPAEASSTTAPVKQPFKHQQASSSWTVPRPSNTQHFSFKRPNNPVTMATGKVKCSAAEIELKKQQAMERRQQRLQNRPATSD